MEISMSHQVRVRFAPAPTGFMHLGNIRAALINYLFAKQKKGIFLVRIEDTDQTRNTDAGGKHILADLRWLNLTYDEGPDKEGAYGPYFQSERSNIYKEYLHELIKTNMVYPCFCSAEELEKKKERQIALKKAPRYDRHCLTLNPDNIATLLAQSASHIWRFKLPSESLTIIDLARGPMHYDLRHFSDFPLTRQDGSFTFIFANFVDDLTMQITHVFRGEEHLSNTAMQAALYQAFSKPAPYFWHLPIICNTDGKKLSKRDFGFSLNDLRNDGYLPEAILNYLAIIGASFHNEIMSLDQLAETIDFEKHSSAGFIRYDIGKLRWINHQWIQLLPINRLVQYARPFIEQKYAATSTLSSLQLERMLSVVRNDLHNLAESPNMIAFYFEKPVISNAAFNVYKDLSPQSFLAQLTEEYKKTKTPEDIFATINMLCKELNYKKKDCFAIVRVALTGHAEGLAIKDILTILPREDVIERLQRAAQISA